MLLILILRFFIGELSVTAYFPESIWYDYHSLEKISEGQQTITLNAPLDHVQVYVVGC